MASNSTDTPQDPSSPGSELVWKGDIVKQLFGDVGELITDFSCAVESNILLHGRMYVTNRFLCFYSNLFGLEKKIRIPYTHISLITKEKTALVIPNAIAITTFRKEYIFRSFWDRDECFNMLKDLVNKHKGIDGNNSPEPLAMDLSHSNMTNPVVDNESMTDGTVLSEQISSKISGVAAAELEKGRVKSGKDEDLAPLNKSFVAKSFDDTEEDTETGREEFDRKRLSKTPTADLLSAFEKELVQSKLKIQVKSVKIPISLEEFVTNFIADDAPYGFQCYHEATLDKDISATLWEDDSTALGASRELRFMKPVSLPGLTHARAKKVQRYRKFGDVGLLICSSTRMEDVPAADTFSVEDMVAVRVVGANEIDVEANFEVKWIKSTIFRRMIESNTNPDVTKWLENFLVHMKQAMQNPDKEPKNSQVKLRSRSGSLEKVHAVLDEEKNVEILPTVVSSLSSDGGFSGVMQQSLPLFICVLLLVVTMAFMAYQISSLRDNIMGMSRQLDTLGGELHTLREDITYGSIRNELSSVMTIIDGLKSVNTELVWATVRDPGAVSRFEDFVISDEYIQSTIDALVHQQDGALDEVDAQDSKKMIASALRSNSLLQYHMHSLDKLVRISSSLHEVYEKLPKSREE